MRMMFRILVDRCKRDSPHDMDTQRAILLIVVVERRNYFRYDIDQLKKGGIIKERE